MKTLAANKDTQKQSAYCIFLYRILFSSNKILTLELTCLFRFTLAKYTVAIKLKSTYSTAYSALCFKEELLIFIWFHFLFLLSFRQTLVGPNHLVNEGNDVLIHLRQANITFCYAGVVNHGLLQSFTSILHTHKQKYITYTVPKDLSLYIPQENHSSVVRNSTSVFIMSENGISICV